MAVCSVRLCEMGAEWQGTLGVVSTDRRIKVAYCDSHARSQMHAIPETLELCLTPVGGGVPLTRPEKGVTPFQLLFVKVRTMEPDEAAETLYAALGEAWDKGVMARDRTSHGGPEPVNPYRKEH